MVAVEAYHERPALAAQRLQRRLARLLELTLEPRSQVREKLLRASAPGRAGNRARDRA